jgi:rsbT co-antagonist protein RsbR
MVLSRLATDAAQRLAAANARAEAALRLSEQQSAELARSNADLQRLVDEVWAREAEQARLLAENTQQREAIRELSVPVLPLQHGTLAMPLIGALDSTRLHDLKERALAAVQRASARRLLLDITGVPIVDTQIAQGLIEVMQAVRLLGTEVLLVGIRPEVAQTIVGLGLDLRGVRTYSDIQSALDSGERSIDRGALPPRRDLRDQLR